MGVHQTVQWSPRRHETVGSIVDVFTQSHQTLVILDLHVNHIPDVNPHQHITAPHRPTVILPFLCFLEVQEETRMRNAIGRSLWGQAVTQFSSLR